MRIISTLAFLIAGLNTVATFPAERLVSMPSNPLPLPIAIRLGPAESGSPSTSWRLTETDGEKPSFPAQIIAIPSPNGFTDAPQTAIAATILPRTNAGATRRFQIIHSDDRPRVPANTAGFRWVDSTNGILELWEGPQRVVGYNYGVQRRDDVPADRARSTYLHPIYGLDGEVLTDDFPKDHYHHRGLFWAWPHVRVGGAQYDLWDLRGVEQRFERWLDQQAGPAVATLGIENGWYVGTKRIMKERVWFRIYPKTTDGRVIDVDLAWQPEDAPVTLEGAEGKSYGGLTLRYAPREDTRITTPLGKDTNDLAVARLPWADLSAQFANTPSRSGAALFVHSSHPDFPPTWLTRHYGALCVGWPGIAPQTFKSDETIHGRYRVWVHRGEPSVAELKAHAEAFETAFKGTEESARR